jgi:hypothetical protein
MKGVVSIVMLSVLSAVLISSFFVVPLIRKDEKITYDLRYNKFTEEYSIKVDNVNNFNEFVSENDINLRQENRRAYYYDSYKLAKEDIGGMKIWVS